MLWNKSQNVYDDSVGNQRYKMRFDKAYFKYISLAGIPYQIK